MSLLLWGLVGYLVGILLVIGFPIILGPYLPERHRQRLANWFVSLTMAWFDRGVIGATRTGAFFLKPTTYDHILEADETTVGDTKHHYKDPNGLQGWLAGRPFMCVFSGRNAGFTPREPDAAARGHRLVRDDHHQTTMELATDGGNQLVEAMSDTIAIPRRRHAVDLRAARHAFDGSCPPDAAEQTEDLVEKSQSGFNSKQVVEAMFFLMCVGVGAGIVYIGKSQFSGGSSIVDVGTSIGLWLAPHHLTTILGGLP